MAAAAPFIVETAPVWVPTLMQAVAALAGAVGLVGLAEWAKAHSQVTEQAEEKKPSTCQNCPYADSAGGPNVMMNESAEEGAADSSGGPAEAEGKQDKKLSKGEIKKLQDNDIDPHDLKPKKEGSKYDLFKDKQGNIKVKPKDGSGPGEETGLNINDF